MNRRRRLLGLWLAGAAAFGMCLIGAEIREAAAQNPENVFKGRILFSKYRFPTRARSKRAYIAKIRKRSQTRFWEKGKKKPAKGKKPNYKERYWKIHLAAFFPKHHFLELEVSIWDITNNRKGRLLSADEWMLDFRGQRSMISNITLKREKFGVNRKLLFKVRTMRGKRTMAKGKIWIKGEKEVFSGKVDFGGGD
jgi:hypothetical protein